MLLDLEEYHGSIQGKWSLIKDRSTVEDVTSFFCFISERKLSQTAETIRDVSVCSHFRPPERTVLQAMNH